MLKCQPRAQKWWGSSSISWIKNKNQLQGTRCFRMMLFKCISSSNSNSPSTILLHAFLRKIGFFPPSCEQNVGLKPGFVTNTSTFTEWHYTEIVPSHLRAAKEETRPVQWVASYDTTGLMHRCLRDLYKFCSWAENCNTWLHLINTSCHQWNRQLC